MSCITEINDGKIKRVETWQDETQEFEKYEMDDGAEVTVITLKHPRSDMKEDR